MLYSNDTTHIPSCVSPYNPTLQNQLGRPVDPNAKGTFTEAMLRASVDEAAVPGMGAELLQPGTGWVAWWPSKVYPLKDHLAWFQKRYGKLQPWPIHDYLLSGGDLIGPFVDECHKKRVAALVSYRMNDVHFLETADMEEPPYGAVYALSKFYVDHPDWRLGPPPPPPAQQGRGQNWLLPEVRAHKLAFLREIVGQYDLDGVELDFMRYWNYFPPETPTPQRVKVMTGFLREVRAMLNAKRKPEDRRLWLQVRVPSVAANWGKMGFDPKAWNRAGVDAFNLSAFYPTSQQGDIPAVRAAAPRATIYLELTHTPQVWHLVATAMDGFDHRRSTPEMLETTARLAYLRGADGVTIFNFPYYREFGPVIEQRGPFDEPPFAALTPLANRARLEKRLPSYFFLAVGKDLSSGQGRELHMDVAPPSPKSAGVLRLQVLTQAESHAGEGVPAEKADRGRWIVTLNGKELKPISNPVGAYPFPTSIKAGFGDASQYLAWEVPPGTAIDGVNDLYAKLEHASGPRHLRWVEIWYPKK
ncbi:MAG: hypothetical protein PW734_09775 [Verrucomicrobium sp.]|nr:hypothetical protein [Verrucomicrobium sp.]